MSIEEIHRGAQAKELLEHPLMVDALATVEKRIIEQWMSTRPAEGEDRERLYLMMLANRAFQAELKRHVETGKLASLQASKQPPLRAVGGI